MTIVVGSAVSQKIIVTDPTFTYLIRDNVYPKQTYVPTASLNIHLNCEKQNKD